MRRLPVYFLIDVSESMVGQPVADVQKGIRSIIEELRSDPYALETVHVAVIAFAGKAKTLTPLTEVYRFYPPEIPIGGGTSYSAALTALMDDIDANVQRNTPEKKGDWKPIVFMFTDGAPTDNYDAARRRWAQSYRRRCSMVAVALGSNTDTGLLHTLTEDVLLLKRTDSESFKRFFKWVTDSIKASSVSVSSQQGEGAVLPDTAGINLEKVPAKEEAPRTPKGGDKIDENCVTLLGKCQTSGSLYLVKYGRDFGNGEDMERLLTRGFRFVGAYPINGEAYRELSCEDTPAGKVHSSQLHGASSCPCCGNEYSLVVCECGRMFCAGSRSNNKCPWCGLKGELGEGSGEGISVGRTRG